MLFRRRRSKPAPVRTVAQALASLPEGWHVAVSDGADEYVAVGPGGVFVIHRDQEAAEAAAERLNVEIEERTGIGLWVKPVVVQWDNKEQPEHDEVVFVHGSNLASWLADVPGWLSLRQRETIERALVSA